MICQDCQDAADRGVEHNCVTIDCTCQHGPETALDNFRAERRAERPWA